MKNLDELGTVGVATKELGPTYDEGLRAHMLRVYGYVATGLAITGLVAYVVSSTPAIYEPIFSTPLQWVVILSPLVFVLFLTFKIDAISAPAAQATFWAFCAALGISMASLFLLFTGTSIARTFFITAGMFGAMSLYGYTTKTDLTKFGSFLIMGLIGVLIAAVVNIFLGSSILQLAISLVGIVVFLGLTAYDTQNIKARYEKHGATEANQKLAVLGALSLFLNFVNLFQLLLSFTGQTRQ
jgi:FtsH-binding integral membrane protein